MQNVYEATAMNMQYYNADGSVNYDAMSEEELAQFWANAKAKAIAAQQVEREFREACIKRFFPNLPADVTGTKRYTISADAEFKATFSLEYNVAGEDAANGVIGQLEAKGEAGALIADRLFKWKPSLSVTEYKNLPENYKAIVDPILTIKPKSTQVEIATPKAQGAIPRLR